MYPPQQNATDQTSNFFWLIAGLTLGFLVLWWLERAYIVHGIFFIRNVEAQLIHWVADGWNFLAASLHLPQMNTKNLDIVQRFMANSDPKDVKLGSVKIISVELGKWIRYPTMIILLSFAGILYFRHDLNRFRQQYKMDSLKKVGAMNWPYITPVLSKNLVKEDLDKGEWAMAKLPIDFCRENSLLHLVEDAGKQAWAIKKAPAESLFTLQMGPLWKGIQAAPIHVQALYVIFMARAHRDEGIAERLLDQIAASAISGRLNFSGVTAHLHQYENSRIAQWVAQRHAYVGTYMATLLEISRTDGVLATSEFLWLKPLDRRLWYILNSVGRQTSVTEVSGLFAHWLAEKKIKRALRTPMVKEAVVALERAVKEVLYVPEGEQWRSSTKSVA